MCISCLVRVCLFAVMCLCVCMKQWFYLLESRVCEVIVVFCVFVVWIFHRRVRVWSLQFVVVDSSLLLFGCLVSARFVGCWKYLNSSCLSSRGPFCPAVITRPFLHDGQVVSAMKRLYHGTRGLVQTQASAWFHFSSTRQQHGRRFDQVIVVVVTRYLGFLMTPANS